MIEKFTAEELEIIKRELKELPCDCQKGTICEKSAKFLQELFADQREFKGIYTYEVKENLYSIADYVFCNYAKHPSRIGLYRRNPLVPHEIADEYSEFVQRVCELMAEYYRNAPADSEGKKTKEV